MLSKTVKAPSNPVKSPMDELTDMIDTLSLADDPELKKIFGTGKHHSC